MGRTVALLMAAGSGSRAGGGAPKQYRRIAGKALIAHAIDHLLRAGADDIQVVIGEGQEAAYRDAIGARPLPAPVIGGATRRQSVANGLEALARAGGVERVLIHDAARPFLYVEVWDRLIAALDDADVAIPALPGVDTTIRPDGTPIPRDEILRVQTRRPSASMRSAAPMTHGPAARRATMARSHGPPGFRSRSWRATRRSTN